MIATVVIVVSFTFLVGMGLLLALGLWIDPGHNAWDPPRPLRPRKWLPWPSLARLEEVSREMERWADITPLDDQVKEDR